MESQSTPETTTYFDYDPRSFLCENEALTLATFTTTVLYPLVLLLSLVGNSLVLWVLVKFESLESLTNLFILNLCLSDLVFSCLLPVWIPFLPDKFESNHDFVDEKYRKGSAWRFSPWVA
ncbi:PREDICTED: chemokine XC receptor 1-like [Chinchilla lanigera]|uniref:chemokine XC receptor 1-like n=1 Tax=Chinchilla lanigera TaxID=34839 RepID=UPI0006986EC2|nr:PREDICTED: chemokine XC receptor 1-like [Chinchilla lanigera]